MSDEEQGNLNVNASDNSIAIGSISGVGSVNIGPTSAQVSALIAQISTTFQPKPFDGRSPYKGLAYFEEADAELFFGREKLVEDLVNRVKESPTLFVTGPSGSGKSSLVRAGLIHALKQGSIKDSERWLYGTMKPGREPIAELARVTAKLAESTKAEDEICARAAADPTIFRRWCQIALGDGRDQRVVIFIDQFEEVFTQININTANTFIDLLDSAVEAEGGRIILLFAMRSDFISNCATYPKLNALLNRQFVQIGSMSDEELVSAIAQPALRVGLRIDPDLIAQIINDMQGEPGALPLMQFALKDLFDFQRAQGGVIALTLNDYLQRGGIRKALERHADDSFSKLDSHEQELARSIFSGLIEIGRGTQDTRRTAIFDELVPASASSEEVQAIVSKLADARLITTDEIKGKDTVTISHEKLIEAWPWLKKLVNENRDVIALQNEIAADAKEWEDHVRDSSYLYSGARLATAREKLAAQKLVLSGLAQDFIEQGIVAQDAERKAKENLRRRIIAGLVLGIAVALALAVFGFVQAGLATDNLNAANTAQADAQIKQRLADDNALTALANEEKAQIQAKISRVGELAAQSVSLREKNFLVSLLLGVEAYKETDGLFTSVQAQSALLDNARANPQLEQFLSGHTGPVISVAYSPDGKILASGSMDNTIILWDLETHKPIGEPLEGHSDVLRSLAFSPDGSVLASGSEDKTIMLWDMATHKPIDQPLEGHSDLVAAVAFSPDGRVLASGGDDKTIILWDMETHKPIGQPLEGHSDTIFSVAFSPDGRKLASGSEDKTIILWDVETGQPIGQPLSGHSSPVLSVAFSPDGKTLASGGYDKTVILWDAESAKPIDQPLEGHSDVVRSLAFSPDGKTLASGSYDRTIILWDVENRTPIDQPLKGHSDIVNSVAFSQDGKTLASGSGDGIIILWAVEPRQSISQSLSGHAGPIYSVAFRPDGKTLASGSLDQSIILWDMETRQPLGPPWIGHSGSINSVAFSPDGRLLASGSGDASIILWDVETGQPIGRRLIRHASPVSSVAFSPDGKILASGSDDKTIILWDVEAHRPIVKPLEGHSAPVLSVAFSPDGKILASGGQDNKIILWNLKTRKPIGEPLSGHSDFVRSLAFSPDGKTLASGSDDRTIILWDVATHQRVGQPLKGHSNVVASIAFSQDGSLLASGSYDQTFILWDVKTHRPIGQPLSGHAAPVLSIAFRPDGKTLASSSQNILLWDLNPQTWIERSCRSAGRNLTRAEWDNYFPGEEYRKTCEQFPLEPAAIPTVMPTITP